MKYAKQSTSELERLRSELLSAYEGANMYVGISIFLGDALPDWEKKLGREKAGIKKRISAVEKELSNRGVSIDNNKPS